VLLAGDRKRDQGTDGVDTGEHGVDQGGVDPAPLPAHLLQQILESVRHPGDMRHPDHCGAALDGVGLAEERGDHLGGCAALLQLEQLVDEGVEPALRLHREEALEVVLRERLLGAHCEIRPGLSSTGMSSATASRASATR
jgi:hypothetical protein